MNNSSIKLLSLYYYTNNTPSLDSKIISGGSSVLELAFSYLTSRIRKSADSISPPPFPLCKLLEGAHFSSHLKMGRHNILKKIESDLKTILFHYAELGEMN